MLSSCATKLTAAKFNSTSRTFAAFTINTKDAKRPKSVSRDANVIPKHHLRPLSGGKACLAFLYPRPQRCATDNKSTWV